MKDKTRRVYRRDAICMSHAGACALSDNDEAIFANDNAAR